MPDHPGDINETEKRSDRQDSLRGGDKIAPMHSDHHSSAHPAVETPIEGRQGFLGKPVLVVLVAALVLVAMGLAAVSFFVR